MIRLLFKDSLIYSISSFLSKGIAFILLPFYTNVFSPSDYGVMDMVAIFIIIITNISSMQLNQAMFRYYPAAKSERKKTAYFSTTFFFYAISYSVVTIFIFLQSKEVSILILGDITYSNIIKVAALNLWASSLFTIINNLHRLNFEAKTFAILSIINTLFGTLFIILMVLFFNLGILGVFLGQFIINFFSFFYLFYKQFNYINIRLVSYKLFKQMFRFGLPLIPTVLILLTMQYIDRIMISDIIGLDELGLYAVAIKISSSIGLVLSGFQMAWGPYIFKMYNEPGMNKTVAKLFYYINIVSLILISILFLFSSDIIFLLTNQSFYSAYHVVPILALSTLFFFLGSSFSIGFSIANRNEIQTFIYLFTIVLNITLNYLFISTYGIYGAATATAISFFLSAFLNLYFSKRFYNIHYNIRKLSTYIIHFIMILFMYYYFISNDMSIQDYIFKILLFCSWLIPIIIDKDTVKQLLTYKNNKNLRA